MTYKHFWRTAMKSILAILTLTLCGFTFAQSWENSPDNWKNSPSNWENSPSNWKNSPSNWENSPSNFNAQNGVFDNSGKRIGYETRTPQGVSNLFDDNGNRLGYKPANPNQRNR
jgi:hypothetical protein